MQSIKDWLKKNTATLKVISAIAAVVLAQFGIQFVLTPENVTVIIPIEGGSPAIVEAAGPGPVQGRLFDRYFYTLARVKAAEQLKRDQKIGFVEAYSKCRKVADTDIDAFALKAGITPSEGLGDGTLLKKIIDWFSNPENQAKLKALIEFIIAMVMMFAQADPAATWATSLAHWNC